MNINMIIKREKLRLISNNNAVWKVVDFYFYDNNGELITEYNSIYYENFGFRVPFKLNSYDTITGYALFYHFPINIKKKCRGKLVIHTAIGKVCKNISLVEYDKNYHEEDYQNYLPCTGCHSPSFLTRV